MTKTSYEIDEAKLPTEEDLISYAEHGWYISKPLFTREEVADVAEAADEFYFGDRGDGPPVPLKPFLDWKPAYGLDIVRMNDHIVFQNEVIRRLALHPLIGAIAARLASTNEIRLFNSSMAYKPPVGEGGGGEIGWHTDRAYWQTCSSERMLTAWIPLHDCTVEMGPVSFVDGSHLWTDDNPSIEELRSGKTFLTNDFQALQDQLMNVGQPFNAIPATMEVGQVSFHHCKLFHGSLANTASTARRNLIVHMQDGENRYRPMMDVAGEEVHYNTDAAARRLPNGEPDYGDPRLFPVIWRKQSTS